MHTHTHVPPPVTTLYSCGSQRPPWEAERDKKAMEEEIRGGDGETKVEVEGEPGGVVQRKGNGRKRSGKMRVAELD